MSGYQPTYITYEEAQRVMPVLTWFAEHGEYKSLRRDASTAARTLRAVRPGVRYDPLPGEQIWLPRGAMDLLEKTRLEVD